jgi:hypothetical protein
VGWDAAKARLFALLEKRGFEYAIKQKGKTVEEFSN